VNLLFDEEVQIHLPFFGSFFGRLQKMNEKKRYSYGNTK